MNTLPRRLANSTLQNRFLQILLLFILFFLTTTPLRAGTGNWINSAGGNFSVAANWDTNPNIPGAGDTASFNIPNTYTVLFTNNPSSAALTIGQSNVTFSASGNAQLYIVSDASTISGSNLTLDGTTFFHLTTGSLELFGGHDLNIFSGNALSTTDFTMAANGFNTANLTVNASSFTTLNTTFIGTGAAPSVLTFSNNAIGNFGTLNIGNSFSALADTTFNINTGSQIIVNGNLNLGLGTTFGQLTTLTISGSNFTQTGVTSLNLGAGANSSATLNVNSSATFSTGSGSIFINPTGHLAIAGGTFNANADITLSGGSLTRDATGTLNLASGKNLTATSNAQVAITGGYTLGGGSTFTINSGSAFSVTTFLDVGNGSNGTLVLDGVGTTLTAVNGLFWGANGGTGTVTLRNGASAVLSSSLTIGGDVVPGTAGIVFALSGAGMSVGGMIIGANAGTGTVTVAGANSTIAQTGASTLLIGQSTGIGTLNISAGGQFTTGTGATTLNNAGTLNITGGTLNLNGNLIVTGGAVNASTGTLNWSAGSVMNLQSAAHVNLGSFTLGSTSVQTLSASGAGTQFNASTLLTIGAGGHFNLSTAGASATLAAYTSLGGGDTTIDAATFTITGQTQLATQAGLATLTLQNGANGSFNSVAIGVSPLSTSIGTLTLQSNAHATVSGNITLGTIGGGGRGSLSIAAGAALTQTGATTLTVGSPGAGPSILNLAAGGTLISGTGGILFDSAGTLNVAGGNFTANSNIRFNPGASFTLAGTPDNWSGKLDLLNHSMIVAAGPGSALLPNQLKQAAHLGAWNGAAGITSSSAQAAAASPTATALAYASGAQFSANNGQNLFAGQPFLTTDTLILYTLAGDANMDKSVTFADFLQLQNHYNQPCDWQGGDFNYDGATTFADFLILQNNYNKTLPQGALSPSLTLPAPEPASTFALTLAGIHFLARRSRSSMLTARRSRLQNQAKRPPAFANV